MSESNDSKVEISSSETNPLSEIDNKTLSVEQTIHQGLKAAEWASLDVEIKREILADIRSRCGDFGWSYDWGTAHMLSRKIDPNSKDGGIVGGYSLLPALVTAGYCSVLRKGLANEPIVEADLQADFNVSTNIKAVNTGLDDRTKIRTYLFTQNETITRGGFYRSPHKGEVTVVLGAGNQAFLGMCDLLYHMFVEGRVVIFKYHPLQEGAHGAIDHILRLLIRGGYVKLCPNLDIPTTQAVMNHPSTKVVHLTGGILTHDMIVWGRGDEAKARREANDPLLKAAMHSELGAVTPYVFVPSSESATNEWTEEKIQQHVSSALAGLVDNVSCNCLALKVLILPEGDFGDKIETAFRNKLSEVRLEPAWYPGIEERYNRWVESVQACEGATVEYYSAGEKEVGAPEGTKFLKFAVASLGVVTSDDIANIGLRFSNLQWTVEEPFGPVCSIIRIRSSSAIEYTDLAIKFSNEVLWGNLSCSFYVPPSMTSYCVSKVADGTICYGTVAMNIPTLFSYTAAGYWGGPAHANNTTLNPQSGVGTVSNGFLIDNPRNGLAYRDFNEAPMDVGLPPLPAFVSKTLTRFLVKGWKALSPFS